MYKVHNATPIHTRNLQLLLIEVYKTLHHLNPEFMWNLFSENRINYQLRRGKILKLPEMSARSGQNTFLFRSVMAWNHLPSQIKGAESLANLRNLLKSHNIYCQCTCCRWFIIFITYLYYLLFIFIFFIFYLLIIIFETWSYFVSPWLK